MILRRLGTKKHIAGELIRLFPPHDIWIEPFFGAGGLFFSKPAAKYNIVNDIDSDVFNLFQVVLNQKEELAELFNITPIHSDLLKFWVENEEEEPLKKALRFLYLSIYPLYGANSITLKLGASSSNVFFKKTFKNLLEQTFNKLQNVQFSNKDFRPFLKSIYLDERGSKKESSKAFIYCDPPYIGTGNNYSDSFTLGDTRELIEGLLETRIKFAISEFAGEIIEDLAIEYKLFYTPVLSRVNIKNKKVEVLLTNYPTSSFTLF